MIVSAVTVVEAVEEERNSFDLLPWQEAFVREYHSGEQAGNGTRSLMKVRSDYGYDRASVEASVLLRDRRVSEFLQRLREESLKKFQKGIIGLVPRALAIVEEALNSESWSLRKWATEIVLDRGLGKPPEVVEHDIGQRLDHLIKELAGQRPNRYARPEVKDLLPVEVVDNGGLGERSE